MEKIERVHFIGIAGSGMSGLALLAHDLGLTVSGSDLKPSRYLDAVLAAGIDVKMEQNGANLDGADIDVVVVSTAVQEDNAELAAARQMGLPIWPRAQMLAWLGQDRRMMAVAGTHGKTTTSAMLASALAGLGADPSFVVGGVLNDWQATAHLGQGSDYVVEADESDESFTWLAPYLMILTNMDRDHMDHYGSLDEIAAAFKRFITTLQPDGLIVYCADDLRLSRLVWASGQRAVSYGVAPESDYHCLVSRNEFIVRTPKGRVTLSMPKAPGVHNMVNATGVIAALTELGYSHEDIAACLKNYGGVQRRFEVIGTVSGITVVDDYGHHPAEIKATLAAARRLGFAKVHVLFQPHRYSRTEKLFDEFIDCFDDADSLALLDIYSAGEDRVAGVSSAALAEAIQAAHAKPSVELLTAAEAPLKMAAKASEGDLILTLGAGDVTNLAPLIVAALG